MSTIQIILIFIVACISGMGSVLDEFQTHRPLIACTLVGLILGDLKTGIIIGGTLEMMALGWMNIGAAMAPDAALASIISTIIVISGKQEMGAGIALAVPLAAAGQVLTIFARTITVFFQHQADKYAEKGDLKGIDMCHLLALIIQALRVSIPALIVAIFIGTEAVQNMLNAIFISNINTRLITRTTNNDLIIRNTDTINSKDIITRRISTTIIDLSTIYPIYILTINITNISTKRISN